MRPSPTCCGSTATRVTQDPLGGWEGDWIAGFKADCVLSGQDLKRARRGALNFPPGPPGIRGVGMYEVAPARSAETFGVTCHHMVERVDAGPIVEVERFPVAQHATAAALCEEAAARAYLLYLRFMPLVLEGAEPPVSTEEGRGRPPAHLGAAAPPLVAGCAGRHGSEGRDGVNHASGGSGGAGEWIARGE
ncbi:hypothetical protein ACFWBX_23520 [Streptomyces sp. NPDC059991]|uniref:hypothetical protein n=1 Tax=Streptomyces sp. NPDC059991 TaxID=3347028 RepID=UPI00369B0468